MRGISWVSHRAEDLVLCRLGVDSICLTKIFELGSQHILDLQKIETMPGWHVWHQGNVVEQSQIEQVHFLTKILESQDIVLDHEARLGMKICLNCYQVTFLWDAVMPTNSDRLRLQSHPLVDRIQNVCEPCSVESQVDGSRSCRQKCTSDFLLLHHHHLSIFSEDSGTVLCACIFGEVRTDVEDFHCDLFPS